MDFICYAFTTVETELKFDISSVLLVGGDKTEQMFNAEQLPAGQNCNS